MHHKILLILIIFFSTLKVKGDANYIAQSKSSSDSIEKLYKLGKAISDTNYKQGLVYLFRALSIAEKTSDLTNAAKVCNTIGIVHKSIGDYRTSLNYQFKSLQLQLKLKNEAGVARAYNNISLVYSLKNDFFKAIEYQLRSIKLKEKSGDEHGLAISYENLGKIYSDQKNSKKALYYFFLAFKINSEFKDSVGIIYDYQSIGNEYFVNNRLELAREFYNKALKLKINQKIIDKEIADIYNRLGDLFAETNEVDRALHFYKTALGINQKLNNKRNVSINYFNIGSLLLKVESYQEAKTYLVDCKKIATEIDYLDLLCDVYEKLMLTHEKTGNLNEALNYSKLYNVSKNKMSTLNNYEKLNELGIKYETEKKEKEIKLLNQDKSLKTAEISHQKLVKNYFIGLAIIILISSSFIFRLYRNKLNDNKLLAAQKAEIESQKKSITDSINYAYRIQKSILPTCEHFNEILPESFVFNKPKDIVSGDFYWLHETSPFKYSSVNSKVFLALADCTGHGVPGAFMSMMGVELLNEAVNESHSPAKILEIVDDGIRRALHTNQHESKKDGMDIALCAFDFEKNTLKYCGANRPIYRIRNGVLEIFYPQKAAIGFSDQGFKFENIEIELQKNDNIYLFSDGYADQFGGERDKKLTTKKFKDLLLRLQPVPMRNQGMELEKFITDWSGNNSQVDDMLVIGLKV
ncbi:MAG TPA: tetratricopeptide repeat protein [Bacteroidia bacterium]|nr:tetratricopeptide repeat protein [Bacteroidia bacterium]HRH08108.1 tetratricopeptide repeat protein [Bacteroidia bacterium]